MTTRTQIAIDGPAGAGKTSTAKALAAYLGYMYLDTGAIFRALAYLAHSSNIDVDNMTQEQTASFIRKFRAKNPKIYYGPDGAMDICLNGTKLHEELRTPLISDLASRISVHPKIRAYVLQLEREQAAQYDLVAEGRDIGTHVFPEATYKIFLTASADVRAKRRVLQFAASGQNYDYNAAIKDITERDLRDSTRIEAPLRAATDAVVLNNDNFTFSQTVNHILRLMRYDNKPAQKQFDDVPLITPNEVLKAYADVRDDEEHILEFISGILHLSEDDIVNIINQNGYHDEHDAPILSMNDILIAYQEQNEETKPYICQFVSTITDRAIDDMSNDEAGMTEKEKLPEHPEWKKTIHAKMHIYDLKVTENILISVSCTYDDNKNLTAIVGAILIVPPSAPSLRQYRKSFETVYVHVLYNEAVPTDADTEIQKAMTEMKKITLDWLTADVRLKQAAANVLQDLLPA